MTVASGAIEKTDITSPQFKAHPFPLFAELRATQPVCRATLPDGSPIWLVTRYDDVLMLLKDERFVKNRYVGLTAEQVRKLPWVPPMFRPLERNMLDLGPPDHTRLRALVQKAFSPRLVEQMRQHMQSLADGLLADLAGRREIELVHEYALPLPLTIITEILGVPVGDRPRFHRWAKLIVSANPHTLRLMSNLPGSRLQKWSKMLTTVKQFKVPLGFFPAVWNFNRYVRDLFARRRAEPLDDLTTALLQAEEAGDSLNEDELLGMIFLLLIAGHETTVNLISSAVLTLLEHPQQMAQLRDEPALINSAVEELLRYTSPVFLSTERYAREALTIRDVPLRRGDIVFGVLGSANRDEAIFKNPEALDLTRENNRHLGFGYGTHFCLGAPLARLEAQIAINTLLRHAPDLRLQVSHETLSWRRSLILRGLEALPVRW
jgi:cytochrome P450 PksS